MHRNLYLLIYQYAQLGNIRACCGYSAHHGKEPICYEIFAVQAVQEDLAWYWLVRLTAGHTNENVPASPNAILCFELECTLKRGVRKGLRPATVVHQTWLSSFIVVVWMLRHLFVHTANGRAIAPISYGQSASSNSDTVTHIYELFRQLSNSHIQLYHPYPATESQSPSSASASNIHVIQVG